MNEKWSNVTQRIVRGLAAQPGQLVQIRDNAGRMDVVLEIALALEMQGVTPLVQLIAPGYLQQLWDRAPRDYLAHWDRHRGRWAEATDRYVTLAGAEPDPGTASSDGFHAWRQAVDRLVALEDARPLPGFLVAIPTEARARQLGLSLETLEAILLPALQAGEGELQEQIRPVLAAVEGGQRVTIRSGGDCVLRLQHGDRPWFWDDGHIDPADSKRAVGGCNLPAGSVYTTVLESETEGRLWLPQAGGAREVVLHFAGGRIERIEAAAGVEGLRALFDEHTGEPRRVSHVGLGLNPYLQQPIGWPLVDVHVRGCLLICLGENRYMGGQNASSLNVDFAIPGATLQVDGRTIVSEGTVVL
jgi:leucyl aminopeptidase (aminopeptidase T)